MPPIHANRRAAWTGDDLRAGWTDKQVPNNHATLHARTAFEGHDDPSPMRCLFRLWLAPPDSVPLRERWLPAHRSVAPGTALGGITGQSSDEARLAFERRQAADLGMAA
jgi:hypothetical protein